MKGGKKDERKKKEELWSLSAEISVDRCVAGRNCLLLLCQDGLPTAI